jgi:4-hydroxy-tetrahydrodipicolinate synthase
MNFLHSTGVALVTPFNEDFSVDYFSLGKLINHLEANIDFFLVNGTTSESATTSDLEKKEILSFIINNKSPHTPIVYGISGNNTTDMIQNLYKLDLQNIQALLVTSPYYNRPSQEGIIKHYSLIADQCPIPILLYNVPHRTGSNLEANTTIELSKHPNIIGIKEASGNILQCIEIAKNIKKDFSLLCGDDILAIPMIAIGAVGLISTIANSMPTKVAEMVKSALKGNINSANENLHFLLKDIGIISKYGNPVGTKLLLHRQNLCHRYVRLPLVEAKVSDE